MESDQMQHWFNKLVRESRTAKWLLVLTFVSFALFPLGSLLYFMDRGREPLFITMPILIIVSLAFVTTIYCCVFAVIRQMLRNVPASRPSDEDDEKKGHLVNILLTGLAVTSICLFIGYYMVDPHPDELIGKGLFFIMLGFLFLWGAYVYVIEPICFLFSFLSRPRKRENGLKDRNHAEAEARILKRQEASSVAEPADFNDLLALILVEIARTGGSFSRAEQGFILDFLKRKMGHDEARLARDKGLVKHALNYPGDINRLLETLASRYPYPARLTAAYLIFLFAHTQNPPLAAELRLARNIAATLEIRPNDLRNIEAKYRDPTEAEAESARHIETDSGFVLQKLGK